MKLPDTWNFDGRPVVNTAKVPGFQLETRRIADSYYRAELLIEDQKVAVTKRSWFDGLWCHRETEEEAVSAVEALAVKAGLAEPRGT